MAFSLSPSVTISEVDLTNIIPQVATSTGATVGQFVWGPVEEITIIDNEEELADVFGAPTVTVYKDFLCSASFLAYAAGLKLVRVVGSGALNAASTGTSSGTAILIKNQTVYDVTSFTSSTNLWVAKCPGALGNSLGVAFADTAGFNDVDSNGDKTWPWEDLFDSAPGTNEFHVVVYDAGGLITGTVGTVLERFAYVSTSTTAMDFDGTPAYFKTKINNLSKWIWVAKTSLLTGTNNGRALNGGADGSDATEADRNAGFALFANGETTDVSLVFASGAGATASKYIIDNVAEVRRDCLAIVSPLEADVVNVTNETTLLNNILTTRNTYGSSSYAVMDSAYKYMYDRYNDTYRWVPLNGDIAGIMARTDANYDPWFSPAGFEKGRIKNALKLTGNQTKPTRDELYKKGINPCTFFPVEGPILFGDKTLLTRPSAFDRINVRRLFIVLQKAIATAAKYMLFEDNSDFTRARFVNMVEPFLRDVMGRRGITSFRVVCDSTNNTPEVIDRNEFVADIYIAPMRSINFIKLNFVAVRTGVSFDEIVQSPQTGGNILGTV